jgi:O-antigen ligase
MVGLTCLAVVVVLVAIMVRGKAAGPLHASERLYLMAAPVPVVVAFVLPGFISMAMSGSGSSRPWGVSLSVAGGWLSLALVLTGLLLLGLRSKRQQAWDRRLLVGLMLAALPAVLIALVALMYAI